ncbi:MAG: LysR substrate-binding domain-containing protein [Gammaproteobacteria bacterium]|nr:LysR substrate-binding domain-containing protein [Gammaproteobacteria bacterium]
MNLNALRFAIAVAEERNFRRAAQRCFVSQPALTLAIQKLESSLGIYIFERNKSRVEITDAGAVIINQARRVVEEAARLQEFAIQYRDPLSGPLRLGVIYTIGPYLLPDIIPILHKLAPRMPLIVEENTTVNLESLLRAGKLDAAIIALPFEVSGIVKRVLYDESFEVVFPNDHAWRHKREIHPGELASEHVLLLNSGHCFSNQIVEACPELSRHSDDIQQGNSLETLRNMVASGLGVTVLPCSANTEKYRSPLITSRRFASPAPSRRVALAWRVSFTRSAAIEIIIQAITSITSACYRPVKN